MIIVAAVVSVTMAFPDVGAAAPQPPAADSAAEDEITDSGRDLCAGHAHWKMCAMFALKRGKHKMSKTDLSKCCRTIQKFESERESGEQQLLQLAASTRQQEEDLMKHTHGTKLKLSIPGAITEAPRPPGMDEPAHDDSWQHPILIDNAQHDAALQPRGQVEPPPPPHDVFVQPQGHQQAEVPTQLEAPPAVPEPPAPPAPVDQPQPAFPDTPARPSLTAATERHNLDPAVAAATAAAAAQASLLAGSPVPSATLDLLSASDSAAALSAIVQATSQDPSLPPNSRLAHEAAQGEPVVGDGLERLNEHYLLIAVATAPRHFQERQVIRETWGTMTEKGLFLTEEQKLKTVVRFFIGDLAGTEDEPDNLAEELQRENKAHHDIVRLPGLTESYANLTLKSVAMMRYARDHGFKGFFKTDDDSFLRLDRLHSTIKEYRDTSVTYGAHCTFDFPINDNPDSKNYMRDTFDHDLIPVLCHGGGYYLGRSLFEYVVSAWDEGKLIHHRNEDVAVSLWLTGPDSKAPNLVLDPNMEVTFFWEECNPESVYMNPMRVMDHYEVWKNLLESNNPCAHDFELQEYLDLLDELSRQDNEAASQKNLQMEYTAQVGKPL